MEPWISKEKRASTSVETLPGTICRISLPNSTSRRSRVESTFSSMSLPCDQCQSAFVDGGRLIAPAHMVFSVCDSDIHQLSILRLLRRSQNERWVGGGILRLIFANSSKVARITHDGSAFGLQLLQRRGHDCFRVRGVVVGERMLDKANLRAMFSSEDLRILSGLAPPKI